MKATKRAVLADRRLRILQVGKYYHPFHGGMETHLQHLCDQLREETELEIIVANHGAQRRRQIIERHSGFRLTRMGVLFNVSSAPVCPQIFSAMRQTSADIVHLHHPNPIATLAYLASGYRGNLVVTYHSDVVRQRTLAKLFDPFLSQLLKRAAAIIVTSPHYIENSTFLSRCRQKCHVIPFGVPLEPYRHCDQAAITGIRRQYGAKIILAVGRLVYYKGFEYLIQAMRQVDAHLLLIGGGPLREQLERSVDQFQLRHRVTFLGQVSEVALTNYYHAADVFALPSILRSEAFGIVQLEAMACGKPVVNTQLDSGVPYVSRHGETGLTVPPRDAPALAAALQRLLADPVLRRQYGNAALMRVETEFSEETMTRRLLQLYAKVAKVAQPALGTVIMESV